MTEDEKAKLDAGNTAIAILAAVMKMSDHAESMGGARSIAGVAALNTLQKNGPRMAKIAGIMTGQPR